METNRGSIGHFVTLKALASVGLKPEDIDLHFLPPPDAKLALTQGSVDAWATWEPYTALAETGGHPRMLVNGRGLWSGLSCLAATESALRDKRSVLQDFKLRVARAQVWSYQHPAEFGTALARIVDIPAEAARLQFERRGTRWQDIDSQVVADQQRTADCYLSAGLVKQRLDVRVTPSTPASTSRADPSRHTASAIVLMNARCSSPGAAAEQFDGCSRRLTSMDFLGNSRRVKTAVHDRLSSELHLDIHARAEFCNGLK